MSAEPPDLDAIRARPQAAHGRATTGAASKQLAETPEFQAAPAPRVPGATPRSRNDPVGRRDFLKLMGASLALAGLTACTRQPDETIVPYVRQPRRTSFPGKPLFFATAMPLGGVATGAPGRKPQGRPTKIEGNPEHPASRGATDVFAQASILGLYDPDRSQTITERGDIRPWSGFVTALRGRAVGAGQRQGAGLRILTETVTSPTLGRAARTQVLAALPEARWIQWDPPPRDNARAGARMAFGEHVERALRLRQGRRRRVARRRFPDRRDRAGRERTPARSRAPPASTRDPGADEPSLRRREHAVGHRRPRRPPPAAQGRPDRGLRPRRGCRRRRRRRHRHRAGGRDALRRRRSPRTWPPTAAPRSSSPATQPPAVHAVAHAINDALGNVGETVSYLPPAEAEPGEQHRGAPPAGRDIERRQGADARHRRRVEPGVHRAGRPEVRRGAAEGGAGAPTSGCSSTRPPRLCHWHVPATHYLEMWSDARAFDGTVSIVQPLIAPLYGGKSPHEMLATLSDRAERDGYDVIREYWAAIAAGSPAASAPASATNASATQSAAAAPQPVAPPATAFFEKQWRKWLHDGVHRRLAVRAARRDAHRRWTGSGARRPPRPASRSSSSATARSTTAASPTTAGCRSCPNR